MAAESLSSAVQYVAKMIIMFLPFLTWSFAIKISVAHHQHGDMKPPVHINLHLHLDGNKADGTALDPNLLHIQPQQLQCSMTKNRPGPAGVEYETTSIPPNEVQKWLSELENVSVEDTDGIRHTIVFTPQEQKAVFEGVSLLPGCVKGQIGDPMGECEDANSSLLALCGTKLPELDGLGANNEILLTEVRVYARSLYNNNMVPFPSGDEDQDFKLAYSIALINTGREWMATDMLSTLIKKDPQFLGAYYARAVSHSRAGLENPINAARAIQDFSKAIDLDPKHPLGWEKRAEVFATQGRHREAFTDISKAIELRPTARLYKHRGYMMFREENYAAAAADLMESVKRDPKQIDLMHLLGISLTHQGKVHESIRVYKRAAELKPDYPDLLRSLAQAYRELGDFANALEYFNQALAYSPHNVPTVQLRGALLYYSGRPKEALLDYKFCLALDPTNEECRYMKGVCLAAMGQYFESVKTVTRLMIKPQISAGWLEGEKVKYLRELSRYLHTRLDIPFNEYSMDQDLDGVLKDRWVKNLPFQPEGYREMPGVGPEISGVDLLGYEELPSAARTLVCRAATIGRLTQYKADGFLPSERLQLALGLGSLELAQTLQQHWGIQTGRGSSRRHGNGNNHSHNNGGSGGKRFSWREAIEIVIKWRRYVDPDHPVLWLDMMPSAGYNNHMNILQGQVYNVRYSNYYDTVFNFTKKMIYQHGLSLTDHKEEKRLLANLGKVSTCEGLLLLFSKIKAPADKDSNRGFMVSTKLDSFHDRNAKLEGAVFSLIGETPAKLVFSINTMTTSHRTEQFFAEIDHIWSLLSDEMHSRKAHSSSKDMDHESIINLVLSMIYYFYNLMPLSRGSSAVAYTMALGLIMALGREVTGRIPQGKLVEVEALLNGSPQVFASWCQGWMNIKRSSFHVAELPLVSETFPTLRTMIETLNVGSNYCN